MELNFTDISDEEAIYLYSFLGGFMQSGNPMDQDKQLSKKLFDQMTPRMKTVLAEEYEEFCEQLHHLKDHLRGVDIVLQKKFPSSSPRSS